MKLLFVTQVVDTNDSVLGAYHNWIAALAERFESVEVICLREGVHALPANVHIHSLGKEQGARSRAAYAMTFLSYVWKLRRRYDAVFVHMNQEYILIAGWLWKLLGKRIYMWRNHYAGSWATDIAAAFCTTVFCTSKYSYTAKYKKTILMPVGIDLARFSLDEQAARTPHSILFLARIAPSKRPDMLIDALGVLKEKGVDCTASIVGDPLPEHAAYYASLREKVRALGLTNDVSFLPGVPNTATPAVYRAHEIFVNCSPSGMLDKTMFEAVACGCIIMSSSEDMRERTGEDLFFPDAATLAGRLAEVLSATPTSRAQLSARLAEEVRKNSLIALRDRLAGCMLGTP